MTWHEKVSNILRDPRTGKHRRHAIRDLLAVIHEPATTFYKLLQKRSSPRHEIALVTNLARALNVEPLWLLDNDADVARPQRYIRVDATDLALSDALRASTPPSASVTPEEWETLRAALQDPDQLRFLVWCLRRGEKAGLPSTASRSQPAGSQRSAGNSGTAPESTEPSAPSLDESADAKRQPPRGVSADAIRASVLVNAREAAWLARVHPTRWWGIAKRSPVLRRARRPRDGRTFWLTQAVLDWVAGPTTGG